GFSTHARSSSAYRSSARMYAATPMPATAAVSAAVVHLATPSGRRNGRDDWTAGTVRGSRVAKRSGARCCAATGATGASAAAGTNTRSSNRARLIRLPQLDDGPAQERHEDRAVRHGDRCHDRILVVALPQDTAVHVEQEQLAVEPADQRPVPCHGKGCTRRAAQARELLPGPRTRPNAPEFGVPVQDVESAVRADHRRGEDRRAERRTPQLLESGELVGRHIAGLEREV